MTEKPLTTSQLIKANEDLIKAGADKELVHPFKDRGRHGNLRWRIEGEYGVVGESVGIACRWCDEMILEGQTHVAEGEISTTSKTSKLNGQLGPLSSRTISDPGDDAWWYHLSCLPTGTLRNWSGYQTIKPDTKRSATVKQLQAALQFPGFTIEAFDTRESAVAPTTHKALSKLMEEYGQ